MRRDPKFILLNLLLIGLWIGSANSALAETNSAPDDEALIPEGEFSMGSEAGTEAERPTHRVWLDAFYMDRTEVSNAAYETFYAKHRRAAASSCDQCPVTLASWFEADKYCRSLGKRLPTEAEWEKAARGPEAYDYSFASAPDEALGRYGKKISDGAVEVDALKPNGYGLHNMSGNVWEWVSDWHDPEYYKNSPAKNPQGPEKGFRKGVRGGGWYSKSYYVQTGMRFALGPKVKLTAIGFRCARGAK